MPMLYGATRRLGGLLLCALVALPVAVSAQTARQRYDGARAREVDVRARLEALPKRPAPVSTRTALLTQGRRAIGAYEALVLRYPTSGYSDNALARAAALAAELHTRFGRDEDRLIATRLYTWLVREYPSSPLRAEARTALVALEGPSRSVSAGTPRPASAPRVTPAGASPAPVPTAGTATPVRLRRITRDVLPEAVRVTMELDREVSYVQQRLSGPARVYVDLRGTEPAGDLRDAVLRYDSDAVRQVRVGRQAAATRVVIDLEGVTRHTVFTLYNPFRLVVECERPSTLSAAAGVARALNLPVPGPLDAAAAAPPSTPVVTPAAPTPTATAVPAERSTASRPATTASAPAPAAATQTASPTEATPAVSTAAAPLPTPAEANVAGGLSLSRQLGLGVGRIVIDPGHGGRDPGARGNGLTESALTLDVALRLEKLLARDGLAVVLTRRSDVYVPLEERTAIANREQADLFLSIHVNASRNPKASGVETYFLSFASSPDAEAVAARENAASGQTMHHLPDIVKAIALNNKLDESRDLAGMVQEAMVTRLRRSNRSLRNLGVKKAPFVVLIGASMPSILAEMSFLTNTGDAAVLRTSAYRQRIAEALQQAVTQYRRSLKGPAVVAGATR